MDELVSAADLMVVEWREITEQTEITAGPQASSVLVLLAYHNLKQARWKPADRLLFPFVP